MKRDWGLARIPRTIIKRTQPIILLRHRIRYRPSADSRIVVSCAVVERTEIRTADSVVLQLLPVVKVAIIRDIRIAECQAEGIIVSTLQDCAAAVDH